MAGDESTTRMARFIHGDEYSKYCNEYYSLEEDIEYMELFIKRNSKSGHRFRLVPNISCISTIIEQSLGNLISYKIYARYLVTAKWYIEKLIVMYNEKRYMDVANAIANVESFSFDPIAAMEEMSGDCYPRIKENVIPLLDITYNEFSGWTARLAAGIVIINGKSHSTMS